MRAPKKWPIAADGTGNRRFNRKINLLPVKWGNWRAASTQASMNFVESKILARIRSDVCNTVLVWLLACSSVAYAIVLVQQPAFMSTQMLAVHSCLFAMLALLTLLRNRLPYAMRAGAVITLGLMAGFVKLVASGAPFGLVPLAATIIWSALFFGERAGIIIAATVFIMLGAIYFGFSHGLIPQPVLTPMPLAASTWWISAAVLAATTLGPLIAISRVGQRLELERQQAETASAAKSELLATMGHELKTPLNAIMGFAEALGLGYAGPADSERFREYTGHIHRSAQHLLTIVDDLLELARADAFQRKADVEKLDVGVELRKAIATVEGLSAAAGLEMRLHLADNLSRMVADPTLFQQIMINLFSNAIKFTPTGGAVTTTVSTVGGYIRIEVGDTGIGIPADQLPSLGQPFRLASHTAAGTQQGNGLGLALAKSFAELQGGQLSIRSTLGVGTTVVVDLPAVAQTA
jgi:signal transduction histidine kinase